jgi:enamine deaminase RidA (YjgF/YER057c/UK114 family)
MNLMNVESMTGIPSCCMEGETRPVYWKGRRIGTFHEDEEACYLMIHDLSPDDHSASRAEQTLRVLETIAALLESNGMDLSRLVRTWFHLDHILDWYDEFNRVRNQFFEEHGVFRGLIPASTGIGCANKHGAALVAKALAIVPKHGPPPVAVDSPLQCSAVDYRSAFSRAVEVTLPSHRQLYVSGTASIAPDGSSAHVGNVSAQIDLTLEVVSAILASRGFGWQDTTSAIAYVRHASDMEKIAARLSTHPVGNQSLRLMQADICRDDLLFELELDAARRHGRIAES